MVNLPRTTFKIPEKEKELLRISNLIDRKKYHFAITCDFNEPKWVIYRAYDDWNRYISEDNTPIMRSETNTIEELLQYLINNNGLLKEFNNIKDIKLYIKSKSLDDDIKETSQELERKYNESSIGKKERYYYVYIRTLLLLIAITELIHSIVNKDILMGLFTMQCTSTLLIFVIQNRAIKNQQKTIFKKEAQGIIYIKAFAEEWSNNVNNRKEYVRKEEP